MKIKFSEAKTQGIVGAVCILAANASYLAGDWNIILADSYFCVAACANIF